MNSFHHRDTEDPENGKETSLFFSEPSVSLW